MAAEEESPGLAVNLYSGSLQNVLPSPSVLPATDVSFCQAGTYHQGDEKFSLDSRGRQCTPIACTALIVGSKINPNVWSSDTIDNIVNLGDEMYQTIRNINQGHHYIECDELPRHVYINCLNGATFKVQQGILLNGNTSTGTDSLERDLMTACTSTVGCILVSSIYTIAVIKPKMQDHYYVFDSHSRGKDGRMNSDGKAMLWLCKTPDALVRHIENMYADISGSLEQQYDVFPLQVSQGNIS